MKRFTLEIYTDELNRCRYYDWEVEEALPAYQFIHCALLGKDHKHFGNTLRDEYMMAVL